MNFTTTTVKEKKNLLIAGGTGLIGKELGKELVKRGYKIFVLTRSPESSLMNTPYPHAPLSWKDLDSKAGRLVFEKLDGIINLAGAGIADKKWTKKYKKELWRSRIDRTRQLASACKQYPNRIRCFLSASAIGYYGERSKITYEGDKKGSGFLASLCQKWERPVQELSLRWLIFRMGTVFSEKGGFLSRISPVIQKGLGGPIAGGQQIVSWIDREDLVNMFLFGLENNISGIFNCVSPYPATNAQITQAIASRFRAKAFFPVPALLPRILFGEMSQLLTMSQNISCDKILKTGFQFQNPDLQTSLKKRIPPLNKTEKRLVFEQWLPYRKEKIFLFFFKFKNVKKITSPVLKIKVLFDSLKKPKKNSVIKYKIRIYGIPAYWTVLISSWNPYEYFTSSQKKGPFKKWIHRHSFEEIGNGTVVTDTIQYTPSLGGVGWIVTGRIIEKIIHRIFKYRRKALFSLSRQSRLLHSFKDTDSV